MKWISFMFYHAIIMYYYNHFTISSKTSTTTTLYWTPLAKLSRESAFTRRYRLRFRPQTPSSRTISTLNSTNVDCFSLAMLNRVSCVNETTLLSRVNLCHWYIHSRFTKPIPADPLVNYSQSPKLITVAVAMPLRLIDRSSIHDHFPRTFLLYCSVIIYMWLEHLSSIFHHITLL